MTAQEEVLPDFFIWSLICQVQTQACFSITCNATFLNGPTAEINVPVNTKCFLWLSVKNSTVNAIYTNMQVRYKFILDISAKAHEQLKSKRSKRNGLYSSHLLSIYSTVHPWSLLFLSHRTGVHMIDVILSLWLAESPDEQIFYRLCLGERVKSQCSQERLRFFRE